MCKVAVESREVRATKLYVDYEYIDDDFPFNLVLDYLPVNLVKMRRWCERNLTYDIFFKEDHYAERGFIKKRFWTIYFENKDDMLLFKLTWSGSNA